MAWGPSDYGGDVGAIGSRFKNQPAAGSATAVTTYSFCVVSTLGAFAVLHVALGEAAQLISFLFFVMYVHGMPAKVSKQAV